MLRIVEAVRSSFQRLGINKRPEFWVKSRNSRRVAVSSNCQTGGIAAALQVIFPADEIIPLPLLAFTDEKIELQFVKVLEGADIWVSIGGYDLISKHKALSKVNLLKIPMIKFYGFHPDLTFVKRVSTDQLVRPQYNSAIAVWAYKHGLNAGEAEKFFNNECFAGLGYLNQWGWLR